MISASSWQQHAAVQILLPAEERNPGLQHLQRARSHDAGPQMSVILYTLNIHIHQRRNRMEHHNANTVSTTGDCCSAPFTVFYLCCQEGRHT